MGKLYVKHPFQAEEQVLMEMIVTAALKGHYASQLKSRLYNYLKCLKSYIDTITRRLKRLHQDYNAQRLWIQYLDGNTHTTYEKSLKKL